jgi:hypothetical protein
MKQFTIIVVDKKTLYKTSIVLNDKPNVDADGCSPRSLTEYYEWCNKNEYDMLDMVSTFVNDFTTTKIPTNSFIHKLIIN